MDKITQNIIDLAENKFIQLGIRNVSIDDICNELRISKKTFYKYFPQKENLIMSVLISIGERNEEKFKKICQNKNAIDGLILIIKELKKNEDKRSQVFMHDLQKYYPEIFHRFKEERRTRIKDNFEKNLQKGIEEGYYRSDMDVEMVSYFHSIQIGNIFQEIHKADPKIKGKRMMDFFVDLIIRLITNEKGFEYIQNNLKDTNQE
ncbi:putative Regulatory protein TetR [uncultured Paludibacter sp.]|nr:putative Regulatory protein TetR [uncultured Paludibacter sp.]